MGRAYAGNKTAVISTVERGGKVRSRAVENVTAEILDAILWAGIHTNTRKLTDGVRTIAGIERAEGKRLMLARKTA